MHTPPHQLLGHKPFLVRLIGKMHHGLDLLEYFCNRDSFVGWGGSGNTNETCTIS